MVREKIVLIAEELEDAILNYEEVLRKYSAEKKIKLTGYTYPLIPPEITSAFGIESVKLPETVITGERKLQPDNGVYDAIILPETDIPCFSCDTSGIPVFRIKYPSGYGEDAAVQIHNETAAMLASLFGIDLKNIDIPELQKRTAVFESLRRSVRRITSLHYGRKGLLTYEELDLVFEVSAIFPPDTALKLITPLLEVSDSIQPEKREYKAKALIYGARRIPPEITGYIESRGIDVMEDDTCRGRRLFDISLNYESEFIFYELLDAYSYRPMSPCIRSAEERYELLYKLLRNYGITLLVFFRDDTCGISSEAISYLRIRCMRDGIDPLVIDRNNFKKMIDDYTERL